MDDFHYVAAARRLAPQIAAAGERNDRERRLHPAVVAAMADAGLFRMLLPRSIGGGEASPAILLSTLEAVASADGSTGWCLAQNAISAMQVAPFLRPDVLREIFGQPDTILANGTGGNGRASATDGGFRLTGEWAFASGVMHATWLKAACPAFAGDGAPLRHPDGTHQHLTLLFPAHKVRILDVWHVSGLRGTGSNTIVADDVFVPGDRVVSLTHEPKREPGPIYAVPYVLVAAAGFAAVALGIARGALDAFLDLAAHKTSRTSRTALRENAVIQAQVALAEAQLRSARAFLFERAQAVWDTVVGGGTPPRKQTALLRLAAVNASHQAAHVTDAVYRAAGATAIFESNPYERRFRDVHAVTQQVQSHQHHLETVGAFLLGLDPHTTYF